jgi:DNA-binding winged helix-turn-helix (wHTH) protein/Tfp pilus assembly protein PilF
MLNTHTMAALEDHRVGDLEVSPGRRRITGPAGEATLEPLVMHLLLLLLATVDKVVPRQALFSALWGSPAIGDDSLNRLVASLRRALAQTGSLVEIETVPRTGYRLIIGLSDQALTERPPTETGATRRKVLVAAAGATLLVGGVSSVALWRDRANRERSNKLTQNARLILSFGVPWELPGARKMLEEAVALDPSNDEAWGSLATILVLQIDTLPPGQRPRATELADNAIRKALAQAPANADALLARVTLDETTLSWAQYEDRLLDILAKSPTSANVLASLTFFTQGAGHTKRSWIYNERAIAADPIAPGPRWRKALKSWILGRTADADRIVDLLRTRWPDHPWVWNARFLIYAFSGRPHAALEMISDPAQRPRSVTAETMASWRPTLAALDSPSEALVGDAVAANLAAARKSPGQAAYAAMSLSALGELDAAFEVAEGFLIARGPLLTRDRAEPTRLMVNDPSWRRTQWLFTPPMKGFRADPRFAGLCDALTLTNYWRIRGAPDVV